MADRVVVALFRHGLTEANHRKAYLGWGDSPLRKVECEYIQPSSHYDVYYCSDLQRCALTMKQLFPKAAPYFLPELREMNFGDWEGKTYQDLKEENLYCNWLTNPYKYAPPNGESFQQFSNRVAAGWKKLVFEILSEDLGSCAIMTHGGVIRLLLEDFAPRAKGFWQWQATHDSAYELIFSTAALRRGERCTLLREVPLTEKGHG
ncbi:histidine phosphatase family protein [Bacillus rubiinfantis]|uniref:histidine phosphatase family protein n=1 Tax=Bacillus rubiinfantis TaxID=1499680 RepID=UPI0005A9B534|nr:histidine phosphatase family protein [Bacillus rubiinfantis]